MNKMIIARKTCNLLSSPDATMSSVCLFQYEKVTFKIKDLLLKQACKQ